MCHHELSFPPAPSFWTTAITRAPESINHFHLGGYPWLVIYLFCQILFFTTIINTGQIASLGWKVKMKLARQVQRHVAVMRTRSFCLLIQAWEGLILALMRDQVYYTCHATDWKRKGCLGNCLLPHYCFKFRPYGVLPSACIDCRRQGWAQIQHLLRAILRAHPISFNSIKEVNLEGRSCHCIHFRGKE